MLAIYPPPLEKPEPPAGPAHRQVMLANGQTASLEGLSQAELLKLQWEQEQKFARAILAFPNKSPQRAQVVGQAYDTVTTIMAVRFEDPAGPHLLGFDPRYVRLVLKLLAGQVARGVGRPRFFEVGYGCGKLMREIRDYGYEVSGIEVSHAMHERAVALLGERYARGLLVGDLREVTPDSIGGRPTLVYWNDVLEHIPPDEIEEYLQTIHGLLAPGGQLLTITPNWLMRPSDATAAFCPPRTVARGLHLKEYRLGEIAGLLRRTGFRRVTMPLGALPSGLVMFGGGGRRTKQLIEPLLDRLPIRWARFLCRGFAMSCTIATK